MKVTDKSVAWVESMFVNRFHGTWGFPTNKIVLRSHAISFLGLVHNRTREEWKKWADSQCSEPVSESRYGFLRDRTDAEWVLDEAMDCMTKYPLPIDIRKIYEKQFQPEDNRSSDSMCIDKE